MCTVRSAVSSTMYALYALVFVLAMNIPAAYADEYQEKRQKIDTREQESLQRLFKEQPQAKQHYDKSYGYAVFYGTQTALMLAGGGGSGVAVNKKTGKRVYMRMISAGVGLGFGIQVLHTIFLFEDAQTFTDFVDKGWEADASASAAAVSEGVNAGEAFDHGIMVYQLTDKGLIAQASLKGTKYWQDEKLNQH